jgi:DNA-binding YbaB/EbfC family protein
MKNFGGFGGANMQQLMKQAQAMQQKMLEAQQEVERAEAEGEAGGGLVKVVVNGNKVLQSIKIDPKACDPQDTEMLEDLITAALNDAYSKADVIKEEKMAPFAGLGL